MIRLRLPDPRAGGTRAVGWPRVHLLRLVVARLRAWICTWACDGYDRRAGLIVDAALRDRDQLAEQLRKCEAKIALARAVLEHPEPTREQVKDALGGAGI